MSHPILELRNVHKTYGNDLFAPTRKALHGVSFTLQSGEVTSVFGHNGAGKTTCFRLILGLIKKDRGEVLFKGVPWEASHRRFVGYMPETQKMTKDLTPWEILCLQWDLYPQSPQRLKTEEIKSSLKTVGLWEHHERRISQLSKGMGRRLAWALATLHRPELLLLDEPFSGLDPLGQKLMVEWIGAAAHRGCSVLMNTHDISHARVLSQQVIVLKSGQVLKTAREPLREDEDLLALFSENKVDGAKEQI